MALILRLRHGNNTFSTIDILILKKALIGMALNNGLGISIWGIVGHPGHGIIGKGTMEMARLSMVTILPILLCTYT